jgi:hypothetical protein
MESRDCGNFDLIQKLDMMHLYTKSICDFGSCNNTDPEQSEAAHFWMITKAYRSMNKVKPIWEMLRWEDRLFKLKGHTALLQYLIKTGSQWATVSLGLVKELPIDRKEMKMVISGHFGQANSHAKAAHPTSCQYVKVRVRVRVRVTETLTGLSPHNPTRVKH